jgi:hypothetical protein
MLNQIFTENLTKKYQTGKDRKKERKKERKKPNVIRNYNNNNNKKLPRPLLSNKAHFESDLKKFKTSILLQPCKVDPFVITDSLLHKGALNPKQF